MPHRLLAAIGYPAHLLNRQLSGPLGQVGLGRVPGALVVGLVLAVLTITTAGATLAAYDARPEPRPTTLSEVVDGRLVSGIWIEFDGILLEGPHEATVEVFGGAQPASVQRFYYLVADPEAPERAMVVRAREPVAGLEVDGAPMRLDGTIAEDAFSMRNILEEWGPAGRHPGVQLSESRLIAYAFATPWVEPSWIASIVLGAVAALVLLGSLVRQPIMHPTSADASASARASAGATTGVAAGGSPIGLTVFGELDTPRGPLRLHGTPAHLQWMNVADVARLRWRYWGAALGDVRGEVEAAVRGDGDHGEWLVVHGPTGSVLWIVERPHAVEVAVGEAFLGLRRLAAMRVNGEGAKATLTFSDVPSRDAALAELRS